MSLDIGFAPEIIQKVAGCCWVNVSDSQFKEVSPGVFQWNPGFDAGECDFRWLDAAGELVGSADGCVATGLTLLKSPNVLDLADAVVGDQILYNFTVTNVGSATVSNITVTDPIVAVTGGPISLAAGAIDSTTFTASYTITQTDIDAGQVVNTADAVGVDPDGVAVVCPSNEVVVTVSDEPEENLALGLDSDIFRSTSEGGNFDLSDFTCLDGTPIDEWEVTFDGGVTWISGFTPNTVGDINFDCSEWRFRCDDDWSDANLTYDIESGTNSYFDTTINIDQGLQGFFSICMPCGTNAQVWEFRIDDAEADDDHALRPNIVVGDRPNSDPGFPSPDEQWQRMTFAYECNDCVTMNIEEIWEANLNTVIRPDGVDPDDQLGEFFCFYLRTSCNGGATFLPEIKVTLQT